MAVKPMNDILGLEGIIPLAIVFGKFPQISGPIIGSLPFPDLAERSTVAEAPKKEMAIQMSKLGSKRALIHQVPEFAQRSFQSGRLLLVLKEIQNLPVISEN